MKVDDCLWRRTSSSKTPPFDEGSTSDATESMAIVMWKPQQPCRMVCDLGTINVSSAARSHHHSCEELENVFYGLTVEGKLATPFLLIGLVFGSHQRGG